MEFVQSPSIQTDSTPIDVGTLKVIHGSIKQYHGTWERKSKKYNIERQITGKDIKHTEKSGESTKKNNTYPLCLQTGHHQFICNVLEKSIISILYQRMMMRLEQY